MVKSEVVSPPSLGPAIGYSHGVRAGNLLFLAGQIGAEPEGDGRLRVVAGGMAAQFAKALENVATVVREAGGTPAHIVEMTVYVADLDAYRAARKEIGEAWRRVVGRHYPAMTLVQVAGLLEEGAVVELRAVAALDGRND